MAMNSKKKEVAPVHPIALEQVKSYNYNYQQLAIKEWMQQAGQETPVIPTLATRDIQKLRVRLIAEELTELQDAYEAGDLTEVADAIVDLLYVVFGTAIAHGINATAVFTAVHDNNMEKLAKGHKDSGGKWIKPEGHLPPDIESLIIAQWRMSPVRADARAVTCTKCKVPNIAHKRENFLGMELTILCDGVRVKL